MLLKDDMFYRVLARDDNTKNEGCSTVYEKKVTEVLREPEEVRGKDKITFGPERENALSRASPATTTTECIRTCYEGVNNDRMRSRDWGIMWIVSADENVESFVGFS